MPADSPQFDKFKNLALGVTNTAGKDIFQTIAWYLSKTLDIDLAFVARLDSSKTHIETVALYHDGVMVENVTYELQHTPCRNVVGRDFYYIAEGVCQHYPGDSMLTDLGFEGYAGFPLYDSQGTPWGLIAVCSYKPLTDLDILRSVMEIFSARASAEIDRMAADSAKKISEESYQAIFDASEDAIFVHDIDTVEIINVNKKACQVFGYSKEEFRTLSIGDLGVGEAPFDMETALYYISKAKAGEPQRVEWQRKTKSGETAWDEVSIKCATIDGVDRLLVFSRDITDRKRFDQQLKDREEQYRIVFESALDCIVTMDSSGKIVEFNPTSEETFGYTREQALGKPLAELIIPERYRKAHFAGLERFLHLGTRKYLGERVEVTCMRADGSEFPAELAMDAAQTSDGLIFIGYLRDITERVNADKERSRLEQQLRQAQKMEAIGHLTGGIAHDFNNILTSILGYVVIAEEHAESYSDVKLNKYLDRASRSGKKARDLIQQMLTFSRGKRGEPRVINMEPVIKESVRLLEASLSSSIELKLNIEPGIPQILLDPVHLEQVLLNLCINARDAMQGSGTIEVGVKRYQCHQQCNCSACRQSFSGSYVEIYIKDHGPGIEQNVIDRIFEPFYTTKEVGKGTGMGLSTVHGIVHEYNGHILVDTELNQGTTFRVLLKPIEEQFSVASDQSTIEAQKKKTRIGLRGRVLIVDDEPDVLEFVSDMFEEWGLEVQACGNGHNALALLESNNNIDIVMTDYTMPRMNGLELAAKIREFLPDIPIILYTGNDASISSQQLKESGIHSLLAKPLEVAEVFKLFSDLLNT